MSRRRGDGETAAADDAEARGRARGEERGRGDRPHDRTAAADEPGGGADPEGAVRAAGSGSFSEDRVGRLQERLARHRYFADRSLATAIFLALELGRPLLLEGEAGVGKTEVARVLSDLLGRKLLRLQCYEGLDVASAVYDWDYSRQMLHIRLLEAAHGKGGVDVEAARRDLFGPEFLLRRPLLEAVDPGFDEGTGGDGGRAGPPVLLVDELDRADEEFEAFLLEILADYQVTVPEIGTFRAERPPVVVVTSNRTREIHDALRRRCLYCWVDYPGFDKELEIVRARVPEAAEALARQVVAFVQALRREELYKRPGVAETLDWSRALLALDRETLSAETVEATLGVLLKYQDDVERMRGERVERVLGQVAAGVG